MAALKAEASVVEDDLPDCVSLLYNIAEKSQDVKKQILNLTQRIQTEQKHVSQAGLDFLDVKCGVLATYLVDLCHVTLLKCSGKSIQDNESLHRLVENRTVLEKMKPIDERLKYQISKLVQTGITGKADSNDPLRHKPNPGNMMSKAGGEDSDEEGATQEGGEESNTKSKLYIPPRLAPMHYTDQLTPGDQRKAQIERARRRALNSSFIKDLQAEYSHAPLEIRDKVDVSHTKAHKIYKERETYEENNLTRLPESKKLKYMRTNLDNMSNLDGITTFRSIAALQNDNFLDKKSGSKRKSGGKSKGSGKKKKKFK